MEQVMTCILNAKAGSASINDVQALIQRVAAEHSRKASVRLSSGADLKSIAEQARAAGGVVVGGGGDGTMAAVAAALVGTDVPLGVLPMGTLNHFAKDLGIPLELEKAVRTLFTGRVVSVDVGEVNGRIFLNNSSIGFYPRVVLERERQQQKGRSKWLALAQAAALIFKRSRTLHVELNENQGCRQSYDTPFVFVGNNRYTVAGFEIGTRPTLDDGKLWICAAPYAGRLRLLTLAVEALLGLVHDADLAALETDGFEVLMHRHNVHVATDGEVNLMKPPLRYGIRPRALRVLVPTTD